MLVTEDGGATWELSRIGVDELVRRICFVDADHGWAVGHRGSILRTADGGGTWQIVHQQKGTYLRDISFANKQVGWAVGHDAVILHTQDGGDTWQTQALSGWTGRDAPRLHGIEALSSSHALIAGEFGVVAETTDQGSEWRLQPTGSKTTLLDVAVTSDHSGAVAVGVDGTAIYIEIGRPVPVDGLPGPSPRALTTDTQEPFLAVASVPGSNQMVAVGRSIAVVISGDGDVQELQPDSSIQLPFSWFGGVDVSEDGDVYLAGIRGLVAAGHLSDRQFHRVAQIGAPDGDVARRRDGALGAAP